MFNLDPSKMLIVIAVALIVLGPDKLPVFMRGVGRYWNEFQRIRGRLQTEMNGAISQISEVVGPLSTAIDLGASQLKGPLGFAASFLGPTSTEITSSTSQTVEVIGSNISNNRTSGPYVAGSPILTLNPWSIQDGIAHPTINSDPYLN